MAKEKVSSNGFLEGAASEDQAFAEGLNNKLIEQGCDPVVEEAKSSYVVMYQFNKKTVMNWVSHKSGILARIYGDSIGKYKDAIVSLPADIQKKMTASRDCKRLIDPDACSDTCVKGSIYTLNGNIHKECYNDGMFSPLTPETAERIAVLVYIEAAMRKSVS